MRVISELRTNWQADEDQLDKLQEVVDQARGERERIRQLGAEHVFVSYSVDAAYGSGVNVTLRLEGTIG